MSQHAQPPRHDRKTLWNRLDCAPDLTRASIGTALTLSAVWIALLWLFYHFPSLDQDVASLFFRAQACGDTLGQVICGDFPVSQNALAKLVRKLLFFMPHGMILCLLVALVVCLVQSKDKRVSEFPLLKKRNNDGITKLSLALISVLIGPIFIVNAVLKEWSGRPRPMETNLFGGPFDFMPAGSFAGACQSNCSFISGEAAGAGMLLCIVALLPDVWRKRLGPALVIASILTPLLRVAFGGHYLSDAILGWLSSPVIFAWVFAIYHLRTKPQKRSYSDR